MIEFGSGQQRQLRASEIERIAAVHEAGHAVAAYVLNVPFDGATIRPREEYQRMERDPSLTTIDAGSVPYRYHLKPSLVKDGNAWRPAPDTTEAVNRHITCRLAGRAVEVIVFGDYLRGGDEQDMINLHNDLDEIDTRVRQEGAGLAIDWPWLPRGPERNAYIERMREVATALMAQHRTAVDDVASELVTHRTLTSAQVVMIAGLPARNLRAIERQLRAYRRQQQTSDRKKARLQTWTAIGTTAAAVFLFVQLLLSNQNLTETRKQTSLSRHTAEIDQRASVNVTYAFPATLVAGQGIGAKLQLNNTGKTPAKHLFVAYVVELHRSIDSPSLKLGAGQTGELGILFPNSPEAVDAVILTGLGNPRFEKWTAETIRQFNNAETYVAVFGAIAYDDVFNVPHWLKFCRWFHTTLKSGSFGAKTCTEYNDTDNNWTESIAPRPF